jgi:hypothetical protein
MWVTCPHQASSGYHAEFHKGCYQKHTNPFNCWTSSSDIPATTQTFMKDTALLENGKGMAWHGMCAAWVQHGTCELAFKALHISRT